MHPFVEALAPWSKIPTFTFTFFHFPSEGFNQGTAPPFPRLGSHFQLCRETNVKIGETTTTVE